MPASLAGLDASAGGALARLYAAGEFTGKKDQVAEITVPVTVWQGAQDRMVPFAHGQWLAANVAGAKARLLEDEGHLSLILGSFPEILDDLMAVSGV